MDRTSVCSEAHKILMGFANCGLEVAAHVDVVADQLEIENGAVSGANPCRVSLSGVGVQLDQVW